MEIILNDLSLETYGFDYKSLVDELFGLVIFNAKAKNLGSPLKCHRNVRNIFVSNNHSLMDVIGKNASRDQRQKIFSWLDKSGPFWCESREENSEDYFEFDGKDVTDRGLGECCRKQVLKKPIASLSLGQEGSRYRINTLSVQHGLSEEPLGQCDIQNYYNFDDLEKVLSSSRRFPKNWKELISYSEGQFEKLLFSDELESQIEKQPFSRCVAERFLELCRVLHEIILSRDLDNNFTKVTHQLILDYFHGDKAWFSDESNDDKRDFESQLQFKSCHTNNKQFFSYHGKIKTPQVRLYFNWPLTPDMKKIEIVYFGPKITKH